MKTSKSTIIHWVISALILLYSSFSHSYAGPVLCTLLIMFIIIRYGMKGGLLFTGIMIIMITINYPRHEQDFTLAVAGAITYIIMSFGIGIPVDMMKREQANRIASEKRLRRITDNLQDVIIQMDRNGMIQYISPSCIKVFGNEPSFYLGKCFYDEIYPEEHFNVTECFKKAFVNKKLGLIEYRFCNREGKYVWLECLGEVIADGENDKHEIILNCRDITERKETHDRIKYLSYHDTLTGLHNRTYFEDELNALIKNNVLPLSIIVGDVNGLKLTNDVFGHLEGDSLLKNTAEILRKSIRKEDIVSRWGGDEFAILLPGADKYEAHEVMNEIKSNCSGYSDNRISISIALGSSTKTSSTEDIKDIIKEAEDNMYRHKLLENKSVRSTITASLEKMLFETSNETKEHAARMAELSQNLGSRMGLSDSEMDELRLLALLHDIGKIAVKASILNKPGKLTEEEWQEIRRHPENGYRIAKSTHELYHIAEYILCHHERWDGRGYPQGIKGEDIPKLARIISIIDSYDVITHSRTYKEASSPVEAIEEIKRCSGTQFDPNIAEIFIELVKEKIV